MSNTKPAWVHPTALVEEGVVLGEGTKVWDAVHIRRGAKLGKSCIVGEKTYIAYDVAIGSYVKINACVYICAAVTVEDFCMISAHTVFTNDRFPRAGNLELTDLETSDPTDETLRTRLCRGVTIGANATIGPGVTLGEFSMVGMGSVVTKDVAPYSLVVGNPARPAGWVCACGHPLVRFKGAERLEPSRTQELVCERCNRSFTIDANGLHPTKSQGSMP